MTTKIEWAQETWNPITGCTKISPGCANCYAERMSKRLAGRCGYPKDNPFAVTRHLDKLAQPLKYKKSRMIFVCSMGDLFHDDVQDWMLDEIFGAMLACRILNNHPDHVFMVLTKRPERMKKYLTERTPAELLKAWAVASNWITLDNPDVLFEELVCGATCRDWDENGTNSNGSEYKPYGYTDKLFPLSNVWLGVTAENQEQVEKRIPILLQIPAAVHWVSVEPMLSDVDLTFWAQFEHPDNEGYGVDAIKGLDWVVCGCESGSKARPTNLDWIVNLKDDCQEAGVPFFLKQMSVNGKLVKMPELDGDIWDEYPQVKA